MFRRVAFAVFSAGLLATSACAPITSYSGFQAIDASPKDVKVGEDTKSTNHQITLSYCICLTIRAKQRGH